MTIIDTFANSHINDMSSQVGKMANKAVANKITKNANLTIKHILAPTAGFSTTLQLN